jgi:hypothetical protein
VEILPDGSGGIIFAHSRLLSADDVEYLLEGSTDMEVWQPLSIPRANSTRSGNVVTDFYPLPSPSTDLPQLSVRLRVRATLAP